MALLADVARTSSAVAATRSRKQKVELLSALLRTLEPLELRPAVGFLCGELRQGKLGIGYATLRKMRALPQSPSRRVSVIELDEIFQRLLELSGKGSAGRRDQLLQGLFERLDDGERDFLARLLIGELRQGALEAIVVDAVGATTGISAQALRRAMLFLGDATELAVLAITGGESALAALSIELFRPLRPMLAQTAKDV
ncbi:MAG TPA: ATP-dependent DNA ligase, partial [Polyangiaceae bacterium]|nr:ATP-dependent DNA ligase [Polyangiaceae bacterium]